MFEDGGVSRHQNEKDRGDLEKGGHLAHETGLDFWTIIEEDKYEKT